MTHQKDHLVQRRYAVLQDSCQQRGDFWILYDNDKHDIPSAIGASLHPFEFSEISSFGYQLPAYLPAMPPSIWGHCDTAVLHFYRQHRHYDYYWLVEYDVGFSGPWGEFFDSWSENTSDFLCQYVMRRSEAPQWRWWMAIGRTDLDPFPESIKLRCYCPIFRISDRAIALLDWARSHGWWGNCEILMPTLFHMNRLVVEDMGGSGQFVRPANRERFYVTDCSMYTQRPDPVQGSVRWRPFMKEVGAVPRKLWHPIKFEENFSYYEKLNPDDRPACNYDRQVGADSVSPADG